MLKMQKVKTKKEVEILREKEIKKVGVATLPFIDRHNLFKMYSLYTSYIFD